MKNVVLRLAVLTALGTTAFSAYADTRVNVEHFAPFAATLAGTAVSVNVNGAEALPNVVFNQVSGYVTLSGPGVAPGNTLLEVFAPPGAPSPAITASVNLAADTDYSVAAIGDGTNQPLALLPLVDNNTAPSAGNVKIRVVHAAPFSNVLANTAVSVRTEAGAIVNGLASVQFAQDSGFFEVPAGTYDLKISTPDGATTLINPAPVALPAGTIVSLFAVGDGSNQSLGITAVFGDGTSAALPLQTAVGANAPASLPSLSWYGLMALAAGLVLVASRRGKALRA